MIPRNSNLATLKRSPIRLFTNIARETPGCAMLTIGEPDLDTPEVIREAAVDAIRANRTHYAPNQGTPDLRQAVAAFETKRGCIRGYIGSAFVNNSDYAEWYADFFNCKSVFERLKRDHSANRIREIDHISYSACHGLNPGFGKYQSVDHDV